MNNNWLKMVVLGGVLLPFLIQSMEKPGKRTLPEEEMESIEPQEKRAKTTQEVRLKQ